MYGGDNQIISDPFIHDSEDDLSQAFGNLGLHTENDDMAELLAQIQQQFNKKNGH